MKIANYELYSIETGRFALDGGAMFGIVPKPLWSKSNSPDERNRIELAARGLLLKGEGKIILIDNGNGNKFTDKQIDIYRLDNSQSSLETSLANVGVSKADVTDVILTHLHFDHAGGSTINEDSVLKPAFPNAKYYVQKKHYLRSQNANEKDRGSFMPDDFIPLKDFGVLEFIEGNEKVFPNIEFMICNGHTDAQQLPEISDGETTLLYCCDMIPTSSHIPLPYIMGYDLRPLETLEEKKLILNNAADENWILFFEHDPNTVAAKVTRTEKGIVMSEKVKL
ncbi:MAG: MBL fold metallo-hydrolase [Ignavibacteriales bacterium]|nr:MBL fold metallo-hydrolase [Ignavibacteriales bacterium]